MSRAPVDASCVVEPAGFVCLLEETDWIVAMQRRDERLKSIIDVLEEHLTSPEATQLKRDYIVQHHRLYRKIGQEKKLVVPKSIRLKLVHHYHDNMGHLATEKTLQRLQKLFWFPKMRKLVKEYIKNCIPCCYNKTQRSKPEAVLHHSEPIPIPFRVLHLDHLGPFIKSCKGNTHLLVMVDAFSKFTIMKAVRNTKTTPVINAMNEFISYFGLPLKIITDRGTAFTSNMFTKFCRDLHVTHIKTAVRTPRANGQVERANGTILDILRTLQDQRRWDANLSQVQWMLNSQKNQTTKFSPNELVFNFDINDVVHNHLVATLAAENDDQPPIDMASKQHTTLANIATEREKWKRRFDKAHAKPTQYHQGDLVVIKYEAPATGQSRKLVPKFRGPYMIKKELGNDRYLISDVPGIKLMGRLLNSVYTAEQIKSWCSGYPELTYASESEEEDLPDDDDDESRQRRDDLGSGKAELSPTIKYDH